MLPMLFLGIGLALLGARPARAWDEWANQVIGFSSQYADTDYSAKQTLDLPTTVDYGEDPKAWEASSEDGTLEYVSVGFPEPLYATGVTIRECSGNGFVTRVDVIDTNNVLHQVWSGTDPSQPTAVVNFTPTWTATSYLVKGVKITVDTSHAPGVWEQIDAIQLHGTPVEVFQWASAVIGFSSEYDTSPNPFSAAQALGEPNVVDYGDNVNAWVPSSRNGTQEFLTLGFPKPVYSTGVTIRESSGNGFVTHIDALDVGGQYHPVWTGTDASQPGAPVQTTFLWPQTSYAVEAVKIYVNTDHNPDDWEEIDAAYLRGVDSGAPMPTISNISPATVYRNSSAFTLTVNGSGFLTTSVVNWNGTALATKWVSNSQLTADVPASDLTTPGTYPITVTTPPPGGGTSSATDLVVSQDYAQWASSVIDVSSTYATGTGSFSAAQALGPPDTVVYGDEGTAWTTADMNIGLQTITLGFSTPVYCDAAVVRETCGNGFLTKIEALDIDGAYHTVWSLWDTSLPDIPYDFHTYWSQVSYPTRGLRLTVDTDHTTSWEEIDAVELIGHMVTNSLPVIAKVSPNPMLRLGPATKLVVNGTGFALNSVVNWNGAPRTTTYVNSTTLVAAIPAADISNAGTASITVTSPAPGGGTSAPTTLSISSTRYGDVNNNGTTDMNDVTAALRFAAGLLKPVALFGGDVAPEYPASAAGYGDGRISMADALRIARFVNGL